MSDREIMNSKGYLNPTSKIQKHQFRFPDLNLKSQRIVSFVKSSIRVLGYLLLPFSLDTAVGVLIFSELINILEELV